MCCMYVCMYVCEPTFSNFFSSETTGPIETKFHVELSWDGGKKAGSNGPGHMTNMVAIPIYGKKLKKSSPLLGGHVFDLGPRHTKVVKTGTSCSSLGTQTYGVELGLVDPVSG